jgi:hypothetical protein
MQSDSAVQLSVPYDRPLPDREAILSEPGAQDSFERVTKRSPCTGEYGFDGKELIERLRVITLLARPEMEVLMKKGDWASGTGKTRRTIRRFPDRIRNMANELELLNRSRIFAVMMEAHRPDSDVQSRRNFYAKLPEIMCAYAKRLQGAIEEISASGGPELVRDCREFHRQLAAKLVADVQHATNDCCYADLAQLLSAASGADGQQLVWGHEDLKNLHERSRQKWAPPRIVESCLSATCICLTIEP